MSLIEIEVGTTLKCSIEFRDINGQLVSPTTVSAFVTQPDGTIDTIASISNPSTGCYYFYYTVNAEGEYAYQFTGETPASNLKIVKTGFFISVQYEADDLDYLIPDLRFHMGDVTERKYNTDFLRLALIMGIKTLMKKWRFRYLYSAGTVSRNSNVTYEYASPPAIQYSDERPIILQASIIIKSAELQDHAWDIGSWKDDEVSYSNIASGDSMRESLRTDAAELSLWLRQRLLKASASPMTGFRLPTNVREGCI